MIRSISSNAIKKKKISRQALVKAFDGWRVNMNQENGSASASASVLSSRESAQSRLQSVKDFLREQDEANVLKAAEIKANSTTTTKKQRKAALQAERDRLEAERKANKATLQAERNRLEAEQSANKALLQAESDRLEAEQRANKASLEATKKAIEQQANEAVEELGATNWIGKLLEYRNAHPTPAGGLTYAEGVVGSAPTRFVCMVSIQESSQSFGSTISFSNKKDAKRYASKKAIDWLIGNDLMSADGSVKSPKLLKALGPVQPSPAGAPIATTTTSLAGQVPELCMRLGFNRPSYEIKKDSENSAFWSGYAHFGGDPRIEGKVGEVRSVFGKSNAKEQIAGEVLSFLKDIERQRMETEDKEDRKRKRDSVSSGIDETSGKL